MFRRNLSLKNLIAVVFFLGIAGYAYSNSRDVLSAPEIIIASPENGATVENANQKIVGQALRVKTLYLNGRPITTDKDGNFSENLLLSYGYNVIDLRADGKFGGKIKQTLELVLK